MMKFIEKVVGIFMLFLSIVGLYVADQYNLFPQRTYSASDFGIETAFSTVDYNGNGIDDSTDILLGARADALNHPEYDDAYHAGGFPPEDIGVCTDVIWRAFREAGYDLREMVDQDIQRRRDQYLHIEVRDKNIDFRRVVNLRVFFEEYAAALTVDEEDIAQWQPGDIVIFGNNTHIGIVSDRRNRDSRVYIIHNRGQPNREEDYLKRDEVTAHYRFDASLIDINYLVAWEE